MKTYDELQREESDRLERARSYQQATDALFRARQTVERLTPKLAAGADTLNTLTRIEELAAFLPGDLTGTKAFRARDQIIAACAAARASRQALRNREQTQLDQAVADVPRLEARVRAFEQE